MKKYIFYDLDGTIVDTRKDIALAANHMAEALLGKTLAPEEVYRFVGKGINYLIEGCLGETDPKIVEKGFKIYRDHYAEHMLDHTELYPGAKNLFEKFKDRKQSVVTNKPDPFSTQIIRALKVDHFFVEIIAGNSHYPKKPDPASVLGLLEKAGVSRVEALFIGDSLIDLETGRNAGVETVIVSHGFSSSEELEKLSPDYLVSDLHESEKLIEEKGW